MIYHRGKTYIGTYRSEAQAARAFDFYSLLLHSTTAKTNFDYESSYYRNKHSSSTKNSKGKGKILNPNKQYEMKRLNLEDNFDKSKAQYEIKFRLKAMVCSYKVLRESKAIVVLSLSSILSHLDA